MDCEKHAHEKTSFLTGTWDAVFTQELKYFTAVLQHMLHRKIVDGYRLDPFGIS